MYKAKVNASHEFNIDQEAVEQLDAVETSTNRYHILQDNSSIKAKILTSNFNKKTYSVKVNSNTYDVVISDTLDQQIEALGFEIGASKKVNDIKAPMPGLILEINVEEAQEVKEDDALVILEAMKMENVINSPRDGVIKSIKVDQGDTVDKNALLIEFE
ncbi:acetyl-CoA carboxylase biotin carboxyl carrier protein subunit [Winogradskyella sp.]|jgi:biotin carboxyl carrier protein|uniref:acetyl-CoA carboxylase biotin carboxyl carrier protein subunit n=1 Tax=Winogradskyella sp. TaxID=1883156 RepID=UPI0025E2AAA7|nr:acetyl-CoA carboxylase biotin carboxyl carrier protein subunit [Winogradskyella sp.]MCT4630973.1 acetyl-CoA carboxylase biotin carboxyl carrier protein subunit [Winogradskyella sp.]